MQLLTGYSKPIIALAVTPDATRLFSAAQGQSTIWEWDLATRQVKNKLRTPHQGRYAVELAMSPRGDCLVSNGQVSAPIIWPLGAGEPQPLEESIRWEAAVTFNRAGCLLATAVNDPGEFGVQLWCLPDGKRAGRSAQARMSHITALAFSPTEELVASTSPDRSVRLWDFQSGKCRLVLSHDVVPTRVAFRPDGRVLACAGARAVYIWDVASGKLLATLPGPKGNVTALAYSPDGKYLASIAADGVVILHDGTTNEVVGQRDLDLGKLSALCWRADSQGLFVGGSKHIAQCDTAELLGAPARPRPRGEPLSLKGHGLKVESLRYSRDGRMLASRSGEQLRIWDLSGGAGQAREKLAVRPDYAFDPRLSWSGDGKQLVSRLFREAQLLDAETGKPVGNVTIKGGNLAHLSFTSTGRQLLIATLNTEDGALRLSLTDPGADVPRFEATVPGKHEHYLAWADVVGEDDRRVYFSSGPSTVSRWEPATGKVEPLLRQTATLAGLAVSHDERTLVTLGGNNALVWNLPGGEKRLALKHPLQVTGLACVPGGRLLTSCYDGLVRLWDLSGGGELFSLDLGMGRVYSLAVSPDHMTFAAGVHKQSRIVLMDLPE